MNVAGVVVKVILEQNQQSLISQKESDMIISCQGKDNKKDYLSLSFIRLQFRFAVGCPFARPKYSN